MGMKPRKTPTTAKASILASASQLEDINSYASGLRELLYDCRVPKERWQDALSIDGIGDDYPDFENTQMSEWLLGWFRGMADGLGCKATELVVL